MAAPLLSILVPTVPSRVATMFPKAIQAILGQITDQKEVELLGLFDNKARTTGAKRNALLDIARGEYVVFVDDDDWVEPDWLESILPELRRGPDVVVYHNLLHWPDGRCQLCVYDIATTTCRDVNPKLYEGHAAHIHPWKAELAKSRRFADKVFGEDTEWSSGLCKLAKVQASIPRILYHYVYNPATSETRGKR